VNLRAVSWLLLLLTACVESGETPPPTVPSPGPPRVSADAVERHAEQFETDLPTRPPGSQEEFAAATYITGHLQQAGYVVRLDSVPVANAVRSTNVVALPPAGDAETVVTVSYDTERGTRDLDGSDIGAFLELARALMATDEQHAVEFVALGAQSESALGSKRLARLLLDEKADPDIVHIIDSGGTREFVALGTFAEELQSVQGPIPGGGPGDEIPNSFEAADPVIPLDQAGFSLTVAGGDGVRLAQTLLTFLQERSR
jgi:hypothetical protein